MTYCVGIKLKSGLIALSDTRISAGTAIMGAKKIHTDVGPTRSSFLMVSGLRSVGDKVVTYFEEIYAIERARCDKMYQAVNLFGQQVKKVAAEDGTWLSNNGYKFDIHCIMGGQLPGDDSPKLFMIYPEGNWMEISDETPYAIIGNTKYGKAIMNMGLSYESEPDTALKLAYISFESTRISCNDVGYPIDVLTYETNAFRFRENRLEKDDLRVLASSWLTAFYEAVSSLPEDWAVGLLAPELDGTPIIDLNYPDQNTENQQAGGSSNNVGQGGQIGEDLFDQGF